MRETWDPAGEAGWEGISGEERAEVERKGNAGLTGGTQASPV